MRIMMFLGLAAGCGSVVADDNAHTVRITKSGDGKGDVSSPDSKIDCGGTCSVDVKDGTLLTLVAAPTGDAAFDGWSGGGCSGTDDCPLTITDDVTIDANFGRPLLTVVLAGTGTGTVSSDVAGIDCGSDCAAQFDPGTAVTLTTTNGPATEFAGWQGGGCSGNGPCTTTVSQAETVTANFACSGSQMLVYTGSIQSFAIPACASGVIVDAFGAQGGAPPNARNTHTVGGLGAEISGTFVGLTGTLTVLVGGMGAESNNGNAGGGGGSYVYITAADPTPLVVAGGGGGVCSNSICVPGAGADTVVPTNSVTGSGNTAGGVTGAGGAGGTAVAGYFGGGGGAGWVSNGAVGALTGGGGGQSPRNMGGGGLAAVSGANGGYGGGGASAGSSGACGGGGGYNGGGGGNGWDMSNWGCGGGGGSFNNGTSPMNTAGTQSGNGQVIVSWF